MKLRLACATAALAAVLLTACASDSAPIEPSEPSVTPSPTEPASSPVPEPSGPPPLSCNTIILQETVDDFEASGYVLEVDYESDVRSSASIEALFFDFGGLACYWYLPNSDGWFTAAYAPLTETQATEAQTRLEADGYLRAETSGEVTYTGSPDSNELGHNDTYLFEPDAWYHSNHPEGVEEIRTAIAALG